MHGHPKKKKKTHRDVKRKTQALPSKSGLRKVQTPHRIPIGPGKSDWKKGKTLSGIWFDDRSGWDTGTSQYRAEAGQARMDRAVAAGDNRYIAEAQARSGRTDAEVSRRYMSEHERIWDPHRSRPKHKSKVSSENYNRARTDIGLRLSRDPNSATSRKARAAAKEQARDMDSRRMHDISRHNPYGY